MPKLKPTAEQDNAKNLACTGQNLKINAFAGAGKTSTLELIAETLFNKKILYLAFNKSIADESAKRFPFNVTCKTSHSLAYGAIVGRNPRFKEKLQDYMRLFFSFFFTALFSIGIFAAPANFDRAKIEAKQHVYFDRNQVGGEFYCGCNWEWVGRSGGRVDHASCGYETRAQEVRAARTEWEHIVPISSVGQQRQCWQNGGRQNCQRTDPVFNLMEADMHNLTISVGEVNADRSNFRFGVLPSAPYQHGQCDFKVDFQQRVTEPRDEVKGMAARVHFYFADYYGLTLSRQQQQLFMAWDKQFPVTDWERERDRRIATRMGHNNPFVTGGKSWHLGFKPSKSGLSSEIPASHPASSVTTSNIDENAPVRGNRNSKIYHLPSCPSYSAISERNVVEFKAEAEAINAGFRKARNCP